MSEPFNFCWHPLKYEIRRVYFSSAPSENFCLISPNFFGFFKKKSEPAVRKFGEGGLRIKHGTSPGNIWLEGNVACTDSNRHRGLTLNDNHFQSCTT